MSFGAKAAPRAVKELTARPTAASCRIFSRSLDAESGGACRRLLVNSVRLILCGDEYVGELYANIADHAEGVFPTTFNPRVAGTKGCRFAIRVVRDDRARSDGDCNQSRMRMPAKWACLLTAE